MQKQGFLEILGHYRAPPQSLSAAKNFRVLVKCLWSDFDFSIVYQAIEIHRGKSSWLRSLWSEKAAHIGNYPIDPQEFPENSGNIQWMCFG